MSVLTVAKLKFNLGIQLYKSMQYEECLEPLSEALVVFEKAGKYREESTCLNLMANANQMLMRFNKDTRTSHADIVAYYEKAINIRKRKADWSNLMKSFLNLGGLYLYLEKWKKAEEFLKKAVNLHDVVHNKQLFTRGYVGLANIYFSKGDYDLALKHFMIALKAAKKLGEMRFQFHHDRAYIQYLIGLTNQMQKKYKEAIRWYVLSYDHFAGELLKGQFSQYSGIEGYHPDINLGTLVFAEIDEDLVVTTVEQEYDYEHNVFYIGNYQSLIELISSHLQVVYFETKQYAEGLCIHERTMSMPLHVYLKYHVPNFSHESVSVEEMKKLAIELHSTIIVYSVVANQMGLITYILSPGDSDCQSVILPIEGVDSYIPTCDLPTLFRQERLKHLFELFVHPIEHYLPVKSNHQVIIMPHQSLSNIPWGNIAWVSNEKILHFGQCYSFQVCPSFLNLSLGRSLVQFSIQDKIRTKGLLVGSSDDRKFLSSISRLLGQSNPNFGDATILTQHFNRKRLKSIFEETVPACFFLMVSNCKETKNDDPFINLSGDFQLFPKFQRKKEIRISASQINLEYDLSGIDLVVLICKDGAEPSDLIGFYNAFYNSGVASVLIALNDTEIHRRIIQRTLSNIFLRKVKKKSIALNRAISEELELYDKRISDGHTIDDDHVVRRDEICHSCILFDSSGYFSGVKASTGVGDSIDSTSESTRTFLLNQRRSMLSRNVNKDV